MIGLSYLSFVVGPGQDVDVAEVFVEWKMRQIQWTVRAEGHGWNPGHVAVAAHYRQLLLAWRHQSWIKTAKKPAQYISAYSATTLQSTA